MLLDVLDQKSISEAQFLIPDNYGGYGICLVEVASNSFVHILLFDTSILGKFVISVDDMMSQVR